MTAPLRMSSPGTPAGRPALSAPVYAVVQFDGEQVRDVVVAFEDAPAATHFAAANNVTQYTVAPIEFHIGDAHQHRR